MVNLLILLIHVFGNFLIFLRYIELWACSVREEFTTESAFGSVVVKLSVYDTNLNLFFNINKIKGLSKLS